MWFLSGGRKQGALIHATTRERLRGRRLAPAGYERFQFALPGIHSYPPVGQKLRVNMCWRLPEGLFDGVVGILAVDESDGALLRRFHRQESPPKINNPTRGFAPRRVGSNFIMSIACPS
jgi:hypothetical protein